VAHCIRGTDGWELIPELEELKDSRKAQCFDKPAFGSVALAEALRAMYEAGELESVELVGLCTDICVVSNALLIKAFMPELPVSVDASCCAGVTPEKHAAALETMRSCQIQIL
jgi:nicotinamidase-related amidase